MERITLTQKQDRWLRGFEVAIDEKKECLFFEWHRNEGKTTLIRYLKDKLELSKKPVWIWSGISVPFNNLKRVYGTDRIISAHLSFDGVFDRNSVILSDGRFPPLHLLSYCQKNTIPIVGFVTPY